jgi:5-formaminoimidazole-4-carboxamide-1-(beta)-D-ribofuranosyl 5'-monophosphate synthetase
LEIMWFDKRYESNADSIWRIAAKDQIDADIDASYTIVWNIPMVLRESLLPKVWEMWMNVIKESQKFTKKWLHGPFCLECIIDQNLKFKVFEISARIVAWTNPFINWTPYTWLKYDEPMSSWRRIAREIKEVIEQWKEKEIFD